MAGPWEKYQTTEVLSEKPWEKYREQVAPTHLPSRNSISELSPDQRVFQERQENLGTQGEISTAIEPGFLSRVATDIGKRAEGVGKAFTEPIASVRGGWGEPQPAGFFEAGPQRLLRAGGQAVALAGDITGEAAKSLYRTITPEPVQKGLATAGKSILNTEIGQVGVKALQQGGETYAKFKEVFPDAAKDIEAAVNIAMFSPLAKEMKNIVKDVGKAGVRILPKSTEERLYGSATKMPLSKKWVKTADPEQVSTRSKAIKEGIKSEVLPTEAGLNKIIGLEKQALKEVDDVISKLTSEGKTVKRDDLLAGLGNVYKRAEVSSRPDIAGGVLDNLKKTIVGSPDIAGGVLNNLKKTIRGYPEEMPAALVQRVKRQWYKESSWSGNAPVGVGAQFAEKGRKAVSNAAMNALEGLEPSLKGLNQTDAARIALKEGIERAVGRIGNRNISDLGSEIMSGAGAVIGGAPGAATGFTLKKLIEMPEIKSKLAFAINRARMTGPSSKLGKLLTTSRPPVSGSKENYQELLNLLNKK